MAQRSGETEGITVALVSKSLKKDELPQVEKYRFVEQVLMAAGHYQTAKAYNFVSGGAEQRAESGADYRVRDDLDLTPNQLKVLSNRYLPQRRRWTVIETPSELFRR